MSAFQVLWSAGAGICLTLALLHAVVWVRQRGDIAHALFTLAAVSAAANGIAELSVLTAPSVEAYASGMRLTVFAVYITLACLGWFIDEYLGSARRWATWALTACCAGLLVANALSQNSIVYASISAVEQRPTFWGEYYTGAAGTAHVLVPIQDLVTLGFILFLSDATYRRWRSGDRSLKVAAGAASVGFVLLAGVHSPLVDRGVIHSPYLITWSFMLVAIVMGVALADDVANRTLLEIRLAVKERRWQGLMNRVSLLVAVTRPDGIIDYVNPYVEKVTGYAADEMEGKHIGEFRPEEERGESLVRFKKTLETRSAPDGDVTVRTKDGRDRIVRFETVVEEDPSGVPTAIITVGSDLTEQREAERERDAAGTELAATLKSVEELKSRLEDEVVYLRAESSRVGGFSEIVGESDALKYVLHRVEQVAPLETTVLIEGETGVGKELIARAVHARSRRSDRQMIKVNCAALSPSLIESELFGHERGAFTGAVSSRRGKFEMAHGGTLFLDEVAEMPLELQGKLLRAIQHGELERVGSDRPVKVDVRIITATNRKLRTEVDNGRFREDLYYRLNVYPITVPPLRTRRDDIPMLAAAIVRRLAADMAKSVDKIPQAVIDELTSYDWPGNVRELENVLERAVIAATDQTLRLTTRLLSSPGPHENSPDGPRLPLVEVERRHILSVLGDVEWRIAGAGGAAALLGLNPSTLRSRMVKLGIKKPGA